MYDRIVVIKRSGADGAHFPLTSESCVFGRAADSDIRIQLPGVADRHCRVDVDATDGTVSARYELTMSQNKYIF